MEPDELRARMSELVRSFALHRSDVTPCGQPLAVSEAHLLSELADGRCPQRDLPERLQLDKSSISRLVDGFVERGWAERRRHPDDGRQAVVMLSEEGKRAAYELAEARRQFFGAVLAAIPSGRRRDVLAALDELCHAVRATR